MARTSAIEQDPKRKRVLHESGQTEQERRLLRTKQRQLLQEIQDVEPPKDGEEDNLAKVWDENNDLFGNVRFTREAVLDAENLNQLATKVARNVSRLVQVPRYDPKRLAEKLSQKCTGTSGGNAFFDWRTLGQESGLCFNAIPCHVTFLSGPLEDPHKKERKKVVRQRRAANQAGEEEEEEPEDVKGNQAKNADQLSAVERSMKVLTKTLKRKCQDTFTENTAVAMERMKEAAFDEEEQERATKKLKRRGNEICAIQYLFNPRSFTQTVENIFHFSFLIKKGDASISIRNKDEQLWHAKAGPVVKKVARQASAPPKQAIIKLNMQDWRDLREAYEVQKGDLPHRTGSQHSSQNSAN